MSLVLNKKNESPVVKQMLKETTGGKTEKHFIEKKETKTSFYIDVELMKRVKTYCLNNDILLKDYFVDLVKNDSRI